MSTQFTVTLDQSTTATLQAFCQEHSLDPSAVIARALGDSMADAQQDPELAVLLKQGALELQK